MDTGAEDEEHHGEREGVGNGDESEEDGGWEMGEDHGLGVLVSTRLLRYFAGWWGLALIFPNLLAIDEAKSMETAAMMLVVKKSDPSFPSSSLNLSWKKYVTQELDRPLANDIREQRKGKYQRRTEEQGQMQTHQEQRADKD